MSGALCVCTAVGANYAAHASVLAASFHRHHPDVPFYVLLAGSRRQRRAFHPQHVRVLSLDDVHIPQLSRMLVRYDRKQVVVAAKPALLRHLLESGYGSVLYLDADMLVTSPLTPLLQSVGEHSLTLTPHITQEDATMERALLFAGMYNGGLIGASDRPETRAFLSWWEGRLRTHCLEAVRRGIHYDQRWLDMAPAFISNLHLLRDAGVNVAYWNLSQFSSSGVPLRLFHFSGFSPETPDQVTRYYNRQNVEELGEMAELFRTYAALLVDAGWNETRHQPWPWDGWRRLVRRWILRR